LPAEIIDGTAIAAAIRADVARQTKVLSSRGIRPGLAVILVGDDPASQVYVRMKGKACEEAGMHSVTMRLDAATTQEELLAEIEMLNRDPRIHGILVQMPVPKHINSEAVVRAIVPEKDVDGFHPVNVGKVFIGERDGFAPATPAGVQQLLLRSSVETAGRHCVIIGRSNIVGKPMASLLVQNNAGGNATVTVCHSKTPDIADHARRADILIVAIGRPRTVTREMVKRGAVVIDVGVNRVEDRTTKKGYTLVGDVDFDGVREVASKITPVPGGVGPMTIAMLLSNTLRAAERLQA
jgi:methylenetetrahydrofolate dehydrogenase (NADP+)/methenyltetrahydrofolate cyclohydrolase